MQAGFDFAARGCPRGTGIGRSLPECRYRGLGDEETHCWGELGWGAAAGGCLLSVDAFAVLFLPFAPVVPLPAVVPVCGVFAAEPDCWGFAAVPWPSFAGAGCD